MGGTASETHDLIVKKSIYYAQSLFFFFFQ